MGIDGEVVDKKGFKEKHNIDSPVEIIDEVEINFIDKEGNIKKFINLTPKDEDSKVYAGFESFKRKENKIYIARWVIPYIGTFTSYYYEETPEDIWQSFRDTKGNYSFSLAEKGNMRKGLSYMAKTCNKVGVMGSYSEKAMRNRIKRLKKKLSESGEK